MFDFMLLQLLGLIKNEALRLASADSYEDILMLGLVVSVLVLEELLINLRLFLFSDQLLPSGWDYDLLYHN